MTQGQRGQTSRGGASYFSPRGLWGILHPDTSWCKKRILRIKYKTLGGALLFLMCCIHFLRKVSCSTDRGAFSHPGNMQFVYIWKRFTSEKTNQDNLSPVSVGVHDEPPVETEMELPHHPWQMEQRQKGLFEWVVTFGSPLQVWVIFHPPGPPPPLPQCPISGLHQKWTFCPRFRLTPLWQTKGLRSSCPFPPQLTHLLQQGKLGLV